jgi:protein-S-isoprenylcysteine O-methyltransferase Ste14
MVSIGNLFFKTRNFIFPVFYLFLFIPSLKISEDYTSVAFVGFSVTILGQLIRMITIGLVYVIRGGRKRRIYAEGLVTEGLFSHCRNPMYVGNILMILGMSIFSNSLISLLFLAPFFVFIYQSIVIAEEDFLRSRFNKDYTEYCAKVNRWLINFKGLMKTFSENEFKTKRVIYKEYNTTFIWTVGATLLLASNMYKKQGLGMTQNSINYFIVILSGLSVFYLVTRFFKKREQRNNTYS